MENLKDIVIIYHFPCPDGLSSAYAAWKKFGDTASYIPLNNDVELPDALIGKELYVLDYGFDKPTLEQLRADNESVVVIDHHKTNLWWYTWFLNNLMF